VKEWVSQRKLTIRVEDVKPGQWFKQKHDSWNKALAAWKVKQNEYKSKIAQKVAVKAAKLKAKAEKKALAERKAKLEADREKIEAVRAKFEAAKKAEEAAKKAENKDEEDDKKEEEKGTVEEKGNEPEEQEKKAPEPEEEDEPEEPEEPEPDVDFEGLDVFGVEDVSDIGGKMPLFKDFQFEDYALLSLRGELYLMAHAFGKDVGDEERTGIYLDHLQFYYEKYFGKKLSYQAFGVQTAAELVELVSDAFYMPDKVLESLVPDELESYSVFIKLAEEARRMRILALEMGDETARLKIQQPQGEKRQYEGGNQGDSWNVGKLDGKGEKRKWDGADSYGKGNWGGQQWKW